MKSLDELRKRLFRKEETFKEREGEPTLSPAPTAGPRSWGRERDAALAAALQQRQRKRITRYALFAAITLGVLALAGAAVVFVVLGERASVTKENIFLMVEAPQKITVGEKVAFEVRFQNRNAIALESVDLIFEYPPGAKPVFGEKPRGPFRERISIGRLLPNEEKHETFTAFLFGKEGDVLQAKATLEYRPQNTSARFGKDVVYDVSIERSPIGVAIAMPGDATQGQKVEIALDYVSTTESLLQNVSLDILYPPGFTFVSSTPQPAKDTNLWHVGDIAPGEQGTITIRGTVMGNPGESKFFSVRIGLFDETTKSWSVYGQASRSLAMRETLLAVDLSANENVQPGGSLQVEISWRNNLPVSVRNVIVEAVVSGAAVDYARVRSSEGRGSYDSAQHKVVWTASQEPDFRFVSPGQSGVLAMQVPIMGTLPISSLLDKNFEVQVEAVMFTNTVPEGFQGVETSGRDSITANVITQMGFVARGLHRSGILQNTGPLPPRINEETTYTITWSLTSSANDMENLIVKASIPAYVQWKNVVQPAGEHVVYDPDTREITWDAGFLVAGIGYTRPAREVSFQLGIIPGVSHVGTSPQLISRAAASGRDTFTSVMLEQDEGVISTAVKSDPLVTNKEHQVVQ